MNIRVICDNQGYKDVVIPMNKLEIFQRFMQEHHPKVDAWRNIFFDFRACEFRVILSSQSDFFNIYDEFHDKLNDDLDKELS